MSSLLAKLQADITTENSTRVASVETSALASYALTLLRVFPKRKGDIQMWSAVFGMVQRDPKNGVRFLAHNKGERLERSDTASGDQDSTDQQWRVILVFLELCTFTFQVMDDEEFLSGTSDPLLEASWTRQSALPLRDVETLTMFLKNLAFAMYFYASDIAGKPTNVPHQSLAAYFGKEDQRRQQLEEEGASKAEERDVGGVNGMTIESVKGVVVGVLRMVYQRE